MTGFILTLCTQMSHVIFLPSVIFHYRHAILTLDMHETPLLEPPLPHNHYQDHTKRENGKERHHAKHPLHTHFFAQGNRKKGMGMPKTRQ
jgi:hypothetical protein